MLRGLLICADGRLSRQFEATTSKIGGVRIEKVITTYPAPDELLRIIRVHKADLLFLCVDDFTHSEILAKCVDDLMPGFPVITFGRGDAVEVLHKLMHLGVREHLTSPIEESALGEAIEAVRRRLVTHSVSAAANSGDLYTFFPAKPGVGTSTLAVGIGCALAEDLGVRTLLVDADLAAGTIQFLLNLGSSASLVDALMHGENLDEDIWAQIVGKWDKLEVLHAGGLDAPPGTAYPGFDHVLAMARAQYDVICADLGSVFDPLALGLLRESRRIFLVTTPEVAPLKLASVRMRRMRELGLSDRVSLLVNRKTGSKVTDVDVGRVVGIPVSHCFSNDYRGVQDSILKAGPVEHGSPLGESILDLAQSLAPTGRGRKPAAAAHRRKFLEFFHVPRTDDADAVWRG